MSNMIYGFDIKASILLIILFIFAQLSFTWYSPSVYAALHTSDSQIHKYFSLLN